MPELPEVETVRCGLQPVLENAVIKEAVINRPNLRFPFPENFAGRLAGKRVTFMGRRAKYLVAELLIQCFCEILGSGGPNSVLVWSRRKKTWSVPRWMFP